MNSRFTSFFKVVKRKNIKNGSKHHNFCKYKGGKKNA